MELQGDRHNTMLPRVLAREPRLVDASRAEMLRSRGLVSARQMLQRPLDELALAGDLSERDAEAFDMFVASANRPLFLRTGLPLLDRALHGGIRPGGVTEVAGIESIGKTQAAMTLAVRCALEYPGDSVIYMDAEHNFSAKRLLEIARSRLGRHSHHGRSAGSGVDGSGEDEDAAEICKRVRVLRVQSLADLLAQLKRLESAMESMRVRLVVVDSIAALLLKDGDAPVAQREHSMLRATRDLRLLADTREAFIVVTNRAVTDDSPNGLFTRPLLGETWASCVTTRIVMERHVTHRSMVVVKSPAAGYVVQPYTITRAGVEALDAAEQRAFTPDEHLLQLSLDDDLALAALPAVDGMSTLRSTQQSTTSSQERLLDALTAPMSGEEEEEKGRHWALCEPFEVVADSQEGEEEDNDSGDGT